MNNSYDINQKILFNSICDIKTKCWNWTSYNHGGYGIIKINKKNIRAHRMSYEIFVKKIDKNMQINHLCHNRLCINPNHLEELSHAENGSREKAKHYNSQLTHCRRGHEYTKDNTKFIMRPYGHNGWAMRECLECRKITTKRYKMGLSPKRVSVKKRFMQKVKKSESGCWEWQASKHLGYGKFKYKGQMKLAHRVSYLLFRGEFDDTLVIDHLCCNRSCVNPDHLEPKTREENSRLGNRKNENN